MATIECEHCGNDVSTRSIKCSNCDTLVGYAGGTRIPDTVSITKGAAAVPISSHAQSVPDAQTVLDSLYVQVATNLRGGVTPTQTIADLVSRGLKEDTAQQIVQNVDQAIMSNQIEERVRERGSQG